MVFGRVRSQNTQRIICGYYPKKENHRSANIAEEKNLNPRQYQWANKDHKYRRVLEDYMRLCASCHQKYDIKNNNYRGGKVKM